jgi:hypothetical protein
MTETQMWFTLLGSTLFLFAVVMGSIFGALWYTRYARLKKELVNLQLEKGKTSTKNFSELKDIKIYERLGGGNFGIVYRGLWQVQLEILQFSIFQDTTPVALKKLKNKEQFTEFIHEAEALT